MSELTHDISIVASIGGLDPIEIYATQTLDNVIHFSRGVIDDANPQIPGTTGGVAGNRPDFLLMIAKGEAVQLELDNGDAMHVSFIEGQTFGMLSGKTFTRTTDAGDTEVSGDPVGLDTVVGGRGSAFEYLAVTKQIPDCPEGSIQLLLGADNGSGQIYAWGSDGYFSIIYNGGSPIPFENGNSGEYQGPGSYCIYPSDEDGNPSGTFGETPLVPGSLFGIAFFEILSSDYTALAGGGLFEDCIIFPLPVPSLQINIPYCKQRQLQFGDDNTQDLSGHTVVFDSGPWTELDFMDVGFPSSISSASIAVAWPVSLPALLSINVMGNFTPESMDGLALSLNSSIVGTITDVMGSTTTPTSASQAARQSLYDGGWTLPASWLTDLVL